MVKNLRTLRENMGLSQEKLASLTGLTARRIYSYERENNEPDINTLALLADFFGVSIDHLVGRESHFYDNETPSKLDLSKFGIRIKQFREEKGLSRKALADMVGITTAYLSVIENGAKIPKLETCVKLLNAMDISADAAFMDCLNGSVPKKCNMVQAQICQLTPDKQRFIMNLLQSMVDAISNE